LNYRDSHIKSIIKGVTWRIVGTIDTIFVAFLVTGEPAKALSIGGIEVITKILLYYVHERAWLKVSPDIIQKLKKRFKSIYQTTDNIHPQEDWYVSRDSKEKRLEQKGKVLWLTGLSGAGKTTLANALEKRLFDLGHHCQVLDGDILRTGLNSDLGFSEQDRYENISRTAEIAKLFVQSGIITIVAVISPTKEMRRNAKLIIGEEDFVEVYVKSSLETCEKKDPKGLYKKVRLGQIKGFTGIDSVYEIPDSPQLVVDTETQSIEFCCNLLYNKVIL
jgi:adenylylsulfate kinase